MPAGLIVRRLAVSLALGLLIGILVGEIPFLFMRETARPPQTIEITIPPGTAERVAQGEQPPTIPENMIFVIGDVLVINNRDWVDHKLGPLWIPPNTSAQLELSVKQNLAYECSFQPGRYFGLDVREPLTLGTRLYGVFYAGIPMGILIALYSLALPVKRDKNAPA